MADDGKMTTSSSNLTTAAQTEADFKEALNLKSDAVYRQLEIECGSVRAPYVSIEKNTTIGNARGDVRETEQHLRQLPAAKACHRAQLQPTAARRVQQYAELAALLETRAAKLAAGHYPQTSPYYDSMKAIVSLGALDMDDLDKELSVVSERLATADADASQAVRTADRALSAVQGRNSAILSAGIAGAANNGAFSIKKETNAARAAANLPPILTAAEKAELRTAYNTALAKNAQASAASGGGAAITITLTSTYDCPGFNNVEQMTKATCERLTAQAEAETDRALAAQQAEQAAYNAKVTAEREASAAAARERIQNEDWDGTN